jgi:hypothetical protein
MRKPKRIPKPARCPTLVAFYTAPEVELTERMAVELFYTGHADRGQFNILADCRDLLTLAAADRDDKAVLAVCEAAGIALANIKDRYLERARMGCTADERAALMALVDVSQDWWKCQSGELFRAANVALDKARGFVREAACR